MNISGIAAGDIVEAERGGRRFYAVVTGRGPQDDLALRPLNHNCSYYFAGPRDVLVHWSLRPARDDGRPNTERIREGDLVAYDDKDHYATVTARAPRRVRIEPLPPQPQPPIERELTLGAITAHYRRRGT
jgi:hypothetical protein